VSQARRLTPALVLALVGLALIWAHLAIAALSVCLNETPDLATGLKNGIPAVPLLAQRLLPLVVPFGSASNPGGATCDAAGPARATAVAGVVYVLGLVTLERGAVCVRL
jgi:hypothetical protein